MKKKMVWLVVSCLVMLSLVLASCAPAVTEGEKREVPVVKEEKKEAPKEEKKEVASGPEEPKYGGWIIITQRDTGQGHDDATGGSGSHKHAMMMANEQLLRGDWSKGPAGTGEADFAFNMYDARFEVGSLAESWEISDDLNTLTFHIRKGVHFGLNEQFEASRLVGGRELTAADVAYSIERISIKEPFGYIARNYPGWVISAEVSADDPWTVIVKVDNEKHSTLFAWERFVDYWWVIAPEVIEKYGNMNDWKTSVGTGPFMLEDFVGGSSFTFIRNPNYWMKDPVGPGKGNQLPYVDGVKFVVIPDRSTLLAALRTGKIDSAIRYTKIQWDEAERLLQDKPALQAKKVLPYSGAFGVWMRTDLEPFNDIRVRKALNMSINQQEIVDEIYGGFAEFLTWPAPPVREFESIYIPLEQLPESTRELFEYNPEKAKQLLAEAGYPDGFKTSVIVSSKSSKGEIDILSVYKAYWKKIGVDLEIKILEKAAYTTMHRMHQYEGMTIGGGPISLPYQFQHLYLDHHYNYSIVDDPFIMEKHKELWAPENANKQDVKDAIFKEMSLHALSQAYMIPVALPYEYAMWWPWIKNYYGVEAVGYFDFSIWSMYAWVDQELKAEMGY